MDLLQMLSAGRIYSASYTGNEYKRDYIYYKIIFVNSLISLSYLSEVNTNLKYLDVRGQVVVLYQFLPVTFIVKIQFHIPV
jgi:hypothetical protein